MRNTLKYVPDKDRKAFATDLKTIYQAADEKKALAALDRVTEKWTKWEYPKVCVNLQTGKSILHQLEGLHKLWDTPDYKLFLVFQGWLSQPCLTCLETAL